MEKSEIDLRPGVCVKLFQHIGVDNPSDISGINAMHHGQPVQMPGVDIGSALRPAVIRIKTAIRQHHSRIDTAADVSRISGFLRIALESQAERALLAKTLNHICQEDAQQLLVFLGQFKNLPDTLRIRKIPAIGNYHGFQVFEFARNLLIPARHLNPDGLAQFPERLFIFQNRLDFFAERFLVLGLDIQGALIHGLAGFIRFSLVDLQDLQIMMVP